MFFSLPTSYTFWKLRRRKVVIWPYFLKGNLTEVHEICLLPLIFCWFSSSRDYSYTPWQTVYESPLKCNVTSLTSPIGFDFLPSLDFALGVMFVEKGKDFIWGTFASMALFLVSWLFHVERVSWICVGEIPCLVCWQLQAPETAFTGVSGFWCGPWLEIALSTVISLLSSAKLPI